MTEPSGGSPGILISLDTLVVQRAEQPTGLEEAPICLRRIGWMGRPIVLVGRRVAGRDLPGDPVDREAWVRAAVGPGAYAVVEFEEPVVGRGPEGGVAEAVERWLDVARANAASWLVTDRHRQVAPAREAGLRVILIGPGEREPWLQRPDYRARDLRDAVGHLLAADVFSQPASERLLPR